MTESFNQVATSSGVGVSGMMLFGQSLDEWVVIGTAILVAANLIITLPKAYRVLRDLLAGRTDDAEAE